MLSREIGAIGESNDTSFVIMYNYDRMKNRELIRRLTPNGKIRFRIQVQIKEAENGVRF